MGLVLTGLRQGVLLGSTALRRRLIVSLEIPNKDRSYDWVLSWLAQQSSSQTSRWAMKSPHLSVETIVKQEDPNSVAKPLFNIIAGTGSHYFKYRGAWIQVSFRLFCYNRRVFIMTQETA